MQFKNGAHVYTADDKDVGVIERVVLSPQTKVVTHIVVRQGLLFTEDKVIPVESIAHADEDSIRLGQSADQLPEFAPFEERYYRPVDENAVPPEGVVRPYLAYPPLGTAWWGYPAYSAYPVIDTASQVDIEQNIPDNTVGLTEGAQVVSSDDEALGEVSRIFMDQDSARATHIVISKGWLFKERRLIPTSWIGELKAHTVQLSISKQDFERLPLFET